mgnify:CR=1 FL=1
MPLDDEKVDELASAPKRTRTDEGTVEERGADDLIKLDQYASHKKNNQVPWGMKVARTKPQGPVV